MKLHLHIYVVFFTAFAWLKCEEIDDCESFLRANKILTRSGKHFGGSPQYVRISMLDREEIFNLFVERLSTIQLQQSREADERGGKESVIDPMYNAAEMIEWETYWFIHF